MLRTGGKFLVWCTIVVVTIFLFSIFVLHHMRAVYAPLASTRARWFDILGQERELFGYIGQWRSLAMENQALKDTIQRNIGTEATIEALQNQNISLRQALSLSTSLGRQVIPAGLFNLSPAVDGYTVLVNKGSHDEVAVGDVVISNTGVLVGQIQTVFDTTARVTLVTDPSFKVTARVLNGQTSGILHGAQDTGMTFDLVVQTDVINENDTLVSTGDDTVPAGIVIGTVSNIESDQSQLFKKITVKPAMDFSNGDVMIVKP